MRHVRGFLLSVVVAALAGCVTGESAAPRALLHPWRSFHSPSSNLIRLDVALIEEPVGDQYLNNDLWALADDQVLHVDQEALIEDNGFRVGQLGGLMPASLQERLRLERSCPNPRRLQQHGGKPMTISIGPPQTECAFEIHQDGGVTPVHRTQAQCALIVTPTIGADNKLHLQFTPEVHSGRANTFYRPTTDLSGWMVDEQQPTDRYANLGWEVTLAPEECVLVGCWFDRPNSLGQRFFVRRDEPIPKQRLLVIRAHSIVPGLAGGDDEQPERSPPLAFQASLSNALSSAR